MHCQETFVPRLKMYTFSVLLSQTMRYGLNLAHLDMVPTFLNEFLEQEIYMKPPPMALNLFPPNKVLHKVVYGLKQSSLLVELKIAKFYGLFGIHSIRDWPLPVHVPSGNLITSVAVYAVDLLFPSNSLTEQIRLPLRRPAGPT